MKKSLWSLGLMLFSGMMQKFTLSQRQGYSQMTRLRIKLLYLKTIKTCRLLFLNFLGVGACLVFLLSSIIIFNITLFLYAPYAAQAKMWLGFFLAAVYLSIAVWAFSYVFSEEKWLRMFHAHNMLKNTGETPSVKTGR